MDLVKRPLALVGAAVTALLLAGCGGPADDDGVLTRYELDGLSGKEIVERLDTSTEARPLAFGASVLRDDVVIDDGSAEVAVSLPADEQYVAVAPFVSTTHDCYYHSLATCQGELSGAEVEVTITGEDGEVLVDEVTDTYANGFVGFWLPRDIDGSIEVAYEGRTGSVAFSTSEESPTCLTTLQLT